MYELFVVTARVNNLNKGSYSRTSIRTLNNDTAERNLKRRFLNRMKMFSFARASFICRHRFNRP